MDVKVPIRISDSVSITIYGKDLDEFDMYRLFEIIKYFNPKFRRLFSRAFN